MKRFPLVTLILVALNIAAYRLELAAGGESFCYAHGLIPAQFMRDGDLGKALSSMFLHAPGSLAHIGGNMVILLIFGAIVENAFGALAFTALYLFAGLAGGLLHVIVDPSATAPLVGASGAISGVLAVAAILRPRTFWLVAAFAGINVWHALVGSDGSASFGAHIGGFFAGVLVVLVLRVIDSEVLEVA